MTKVTKGIWKTRKSNPTKYRYGAIVDGPDLIFVDLGDNDDEEQFEQFLKEYDINDDLVVEDKLPERFDTEEVDFEAYTYKHAGSMEPYTED